MSIFKKSKFIPTSGLPKLADAFYHLALENNLPNPLKSKNSLTVDLNGYSNSFTITFNKREYTFSTNYNNSLATYKYETPETIINNFTKHFEMEDQIK